MRRDCKCGHMWAAHDHYHGGGCALCDCPAYKAKRGRPRNGEDACGTIRGYHRHYAAKEQACVACCNALALYEDDRRKAPWRRQVLAEAISRRGIPHAR